MHMHAFFNIVQILITDSAITHNFLKNFVCSNFMDEKLPTETVIFILIKFLLDMFGNNQIM